MRVGLYLGTLGTLSFLRHSTAMKCKFPRSELYFILKHKGILCIHWGALKLNPRDHRPLPPARALWQGSPVLTTKMADRRILNHHCNWVYLSLLRKEEKSHVPTARICC